MSESAKYVSKKGEFVRKDSAFRNWVTEDGSSGFLAEAGRYHLYVSLGCPWAHRTLIMRGLKGLDDVISVNIVDWHRTRPKGWAFSPEKAACTPDTVNGCQALSEIYKMANPDYEGAWTVPVLWDTQRRTIVNNESSEIIRMLNSEFNAFCRTSEQRQLDFYPEELKGEIEQLNAWIYPNINNGVYRSGFAQSQAAYDEAVMALFDNLDKAESILAGSRFLAGPKMTEADIRLFVTLVRFDWVYHGHFKCNKKMLKEYPNLWAYTRDIYQTPGVADTVNKEHIRRGYHVSHELLYTSVVWKQCRTSPSIEQFAITSIGPDLDFMEPHQRETFA